MFGGPASAHIHTPTSSYQSNYPPPTSSYQSNYPPPASSYQSNVPPYAPLNTLATDDVHLWMRQEPKEALVCVEGKEKMRKPVDPPPIIQIEVNNRADPMQHFLQSPYLFMCASLWHPENDEPWRGPPSKTLAGSMVSSLHRLKDIDNKDGAFFVFGDISVKQKGKFRLRFSLFDYQKSANAALFLGSVTSKPFVVDVSKDYKGLAESTYLSRAFSDQGVRLRLRKEPRTMMNNKRSYAQVAPPDEDEDRKRQKATHATYPEPQAQVAWYNPPPPQPQVQPSSTAQYNLTPSYNTASDLLSWW